MAGYGTPLGYGEGLYGETFVPGGQGTVTVALDDGTGAFPHDITAYVLKAEGISFSRGRQDWQGGVTAGSMSLTLNNSDGRFTVGSTTIASPSPIKMDQRVRFSETVNGTTYVRFTGYVKQWPVAWPAVVPTFATAQVVVTDAQARAERRVLQSVIEEEVLGNGPRAYYMLNEPAEATSAADSSGAGAPPLTPAGSGTPVSFGQSDTAAPNPAGTVAVFSGSTYLRADQGTVIPGAAEIWFKTTTNDAQTRPLLGVGYGLFLQSGHLIATSSGTADAGPVADGNWHHAVVQGTNVYLDGALATTAFTGFSTTYEAELWVGGNSVAQYPEFIGSIAHVAVYSSALTAAQIANHHASGSTRFAGESSTTRLTRLAGYAGLSVGTWDTSLTNVASADLTGRSAWDALQEVVDAELGVAYIDGDGTLAFRNRNHAAAKTVPDVTLTHLELSPEAQPVVDDADLLNYVEATANGTQVTQVIRDATSETEHGRYSASVSYLVQTDQEAADRANWIVATHKEPAPRYGTLTLNLWAMTASTAASVLANLGIGAWLQVTGLPSQAPGGTTLDVVVEGYSERISSTEWTLTLNVSDKSLTDCLILDDPTRGVLDAGYRLYV